MFFLRNFPSNHHQVCFAKKILGESSNKSFEIRLPEKHKTILINDQINKKFIFDIREIESNLYTSAFAPINLNLYLPIYQGGLISSLNHPLPPFLDQINEVFLPTTIQNNNEKKADYYRNRQPNRFTHLTWVRHRKMKKHKRIKWRRKNLAAIKRRCLEKNIAKEKLFRAELLAQIKEAEEFDPKAYVDNILSTIDNVPKIETPKEKLERYRDMIRKNRTQTNFIYPKLRNFD